MIAVLTPMGATLHGTTHVDLQALKDATPDCSLVSLLGGGSIQDRLIGGVQAAIAHGATQIGIVEADMRVPADAMVRLQKHHRDIVAANYRQRQQNRWTTIGFDEKPLSSSGRRGVERVLRVGFGCLLFDARIFRTLPQPWFSMPWDTLQGHHATVDYYFATHARAHGFWTWVDHDLSQQVRHTGSVEFGVEEMLYSESQTPVSMA